MRALGLSVSAVFLPPLAEHEIERAYLGLGALLGEPVGQDRERMSLPISAMNEPQPFPGRRYQTNLSQDS